MNFKVGDKVKLKKSSKFYYPDTTQLCDNIGTVFSIMFSTIVRVEWVDTSGYLRNNTYSHTDLDLYSAQISNSLKKKK